MTVGCGRAVLLRVSFLRAVRGFYAANDIPDTTSLLIFMLLFFCYCFSDTTAAEFFVTSCCLLFVCCYCLFDVVTCISAATLTHILMLSFYCC